MMLKSARAPPISPSTSQPHLYHNTSYEGVRNNFCPVSTSRADAFPRDSRWFCSLWLHYW